jgi:pimeloyl-ACP methyl ester carboxylesterase
VSRFTSFDGVELAYDEEGDGPLVILLHGFAANSAINWRNPGITAALAASGRCAVGLDARGHGRSDKPHDPAAYADGAMVKDVQALLDHLAVERADVVGYSMGAAVALGLLAVERRISCAVLGGIGGVARTPQARTAIADALEAGERSDISDATAKAFRAFAESTGADLGALTALQRGAGAGFGAGESFDLSAIRVPTLVIAGDRDELASRPESLAARLPLGHALVVKGTHLSAVNDPAFVEAIVAFVADHGTRRDDLGAS